MEENAPEVCIHLSSSFFKMSPLTEHFQKNHNYKSFQKKKSGGIPVSFPYIHTVGQFVDFLPSGAFSHPKARSCPDLYKGNSSNMLCWQKIRGLERCETQHKILRTIIYYLNAQSRRSYLLVDIYRVNYDY